MNKAILRIFEKNLGYTLVKLKGKGCRMALYTIKIFNGFSERNIYN